MRTTKFLLTGLIIFAGCQKEIDTKLHTITNEKSILSPDDFVNFPEYNPGTIYDNGNGKTVCSLWGFSLVGHDVDSAYPKRFQAVNKRTGNVVFTKAILFLDGKHLKTLTNHDTIRGEILDMVNVDTLVFQIVNPLTKGILISNPFSLNGVHNMSIRMQGSGNSGDTYEENLIEAVFINKTDFPQTLFNQQGLPVLGDTCIYQ